MYSAAFADASVVAPVGGWLSNKLSLGLVHCSRRARSSDSRHPVIMYEMGRLSVLAMVFVMSDNFSSIKLVIMLKSCTFSVLKCPFIAWTVSRGDVDVNILWGLLSIGWLLNCSSLLSINTNTIRSQQTSKRKNRSKPEQASSHGLGHVVMNTEDYRGCHMPPTSRRHCVFSLCKK